MQAGRRVLLLGQDDSFVFRFFGIRLVEHERFADQLHEVSPGLVCHRLGGAVLFQATVVADFHFDQLMVEELGIDGIDDALAYAFLAYLHERVERMGEALEELPLPGRQHCCGE